MQLHLIIDSQYKQTIVFSKTANCMLLTCVHGYKLQIKIANYRLLISFILLFYGKTVITIYLKIDSVIINLKKTDNETIQIFNGNYTFMYLF